MSDRPDPDDEWQFGLDEVGPEADQREREPIEPGDPSLENAFFVLLGIAVTILLLSSVVVL